MAVVCAVDFSPYSLEALAAAAALTRATSCELRAIHVYDELGADVDPGARAERLDLLRGELRRLGASAEGARVVLGRTTDAILGQCASGETRMIVVGAHGAGRSPLLGSVASALGANSPVPVLVVRQYGPLRDAATGTSTLRIDVAFGTDESSVKALEWANELASRVAAVVQPLRATASGEVPPRGVQAMSDDRTLARDLSTMAVRDGAGLIVVGRSERRGIDRLRRPTVRRLLAHATTNVACVPSSFVGSIF